MRFEQKPSTVPDMRIWMAVSDGYSFCISEDLEEVGPEWSGFMASWKNARKDMRPFGGQAACQIEGGPWKTFEQAEQACNETLKQLKAKQ